MTDPLGREVGLPDETRRVVVTFNDEEFTALAGLGGWRPALFSRYRQLIPNLAAMPDVGSADEGTFSAEKVIALRPDLVVMAYWTWLATETARTQIAAAGRLPGPWAPLPAETVLASDPAAIVMAGWSWLNRPNAVRTGYDVPPKVTRASLAPYAARPDGRVWRRSATASCTRSNTGSAVRCSTTPRPSTSPCWAIAG